MGTETLKPVTKIIQHLASCNKSTRDKAIKLLKSWFPSQPEISDEQMRKIWKGLFYCVWHSDKQQVQLELINNLSSLLVTFDDLNLSVQYFEVFLVTMRREWSGIDYLRLDKFYLLIRKFLYQFFNLLKKNGWDIEVMERLMGVLEVKTLFSADGYPAHGVNYHICEIFFEELKAFIPLSLDVFKFDVLVKPFLLVLKKSTDKILLNKIRTGMFEFLLRHGKKLLEFKKSNGSSENVEAEVEFFGTIALTFSLSAKLFALGSSEDCLQGNRKVLFGLHENFEKLEKELANSKVKIGAFVVKKGVDDDEEIPDLVPITGLKVGYDEVMAEQAEVDINGSADKSSKKKGKKAKKDSSGEGKKDSSGEGKKDSSGGKNSKKSKKGSSGKDANENEGTRDTSSSIIDFNETVISNLQMQFEKVAAEVGMDLIDTSSEVLPTLPINGTVSKKRKRARSADRMSSLGKDVSGGGLTEKSGEKSAKKVRFSMKSNIVWKPQTPLPPQSLRLPPSATPRGSALKKGLSPGPIRESALVPKMVNQRPSTVKKVRKSPKGAAPTVKRLRKMRF
ncbi:ribosomal RNA processing protein 1 homolog B-like isoform X3 [Papaver somniferum]|uniref:ribosomal RNA processing protein 1 homolog B-like isoform X3 n=1 Tax=Papaver somniferum TaxID=3469 RepID=UPI000E6FD67E|nr:ribosomal RNA processing protein 1 homolog B-like isoform X3 [Papaver somniferum]